jgi:pilus assembly protein CpaC
MMEVPILANAQILLQVRFAEVDRSAVDQFGINFLSLPGAKNVGSVGTQQFAPPQLTNQGSGTGSSAFSLSDLLNVFLFRPDINLAVTIKALQDNNLLQILAEPNLLTQSGKDASFLAGGEFPIPFLKVAAVQAIRPLLSIQGIRRTFEFYPDVHGRRLIT